jgi:uncharacterized membrane protein
VSSLQGGATRTGRSHLRAQGWTPALRIGALVGGGFLALSGLRRGGVWGALMALTGAGLATRGALNVPLVSAGDARTRRAIDVQKSIVVAAPPSRLFELWTDYESFPRFMANVTEVRDLGDGRSHWVVNGRANVPLEWDSTITHMVANKMIEWRSEPGSPVSHAGSVRFDAVDGGTRVSVRMSYSPGGALAHPRAAPWGRDPKRLLHDDMTRMKAFAETGVRPHDAAASAPTMPGLPGA